MRAVSACLLFLVAASVVSAQSCATTAPSSDPLNTGSASGCALVQTCQKNLCACTGSTSAFPGCLSPNTVGCSSTSKCYSAYFQCLTAISAARQNTNDTACAAFGTSIYLGVMAAFSGSSFNSSALAQSCSFNVCLQQNQTGCAATVIGAACSSANLLNGVTTTPTTTAATTAAPGATSRPTDIAVTMRISGSSWDSILKNSTAAASATNAMTNDLAGLYGVQSSFIGISSMTVGSLIVSFVVYQGSGKSPASLAATTSSATSSSAWLKNTGSVYATVSSEALTVAVVSAATAGPTVAPGGTPAPTNSAASTGAWAVAALAAVLGFFA